MWNPWTLNEQTLKISIKFKTSDEQRDQVLYLRLQSWQDGLPALKNLSLEYASSFAQKKYLVQAESLSQLCEANVPGWRCIHPEQQGSWHRWSVKRAHSSWSRSTPGSDRSNSGCLQGENMDMSEMPTWEPLVCKHHQQIKRSSYVQLGRCYSMPPASDTVNVLWS